MMERVTGDLLQLALSGAFDVIVHGCNCFNTMGAGIARPIRHRFPEAFEADCATAKGDRSKLGTCSTAKILRGPIRFTIVNAYTQYDYRGKGPKVNYDAVQSCFEEIAGSFPTARIAYPMIGAGLAGGDWARISEIIDAALAGCDHTLVVLPETE